MYRIKLPNTMHGLLRVAVKDALRIEATPGYTFNMGQWHRPTKSGVCEVCMAGAVMARRSNVKPSVSAIPHLFSEIMRDRLEAINAMRTGDMAEAFAFVYPDYVRTDTGAAALNEAGDVIYNAYDLKLSRAPWGAYLAAADILEGANL